MRYNHFRCNATVTGGDKFDDKFEIFPGLSPVGQLYLPLLKGIFGSLSGFPVVFILNNAQILNWLRLDIIGFYDRRLLSQITINFVVWYKAYTDAISF